MSDVIRHGPDFWDRWFIGMAQYAATASKDPSTRVGACIIRPNKTVAAIGFNGLPRGVQDLVERYTDRTTKIAMTQHAEANGILSAQEPLHGYAIYVTHPPCSSCAGLIIQSGIKRVVCIAPTVEMIDRWGDSFRITEIMFRESGVGYSRMRRDLLACNTSEW